MSLLVSCNFERSWIVWYWLFADCKITLKKDWKKFSLCSCLCGKGIEIVLFQCWEGMMIFHAFRGEVYMWSLLKKIQIPSGLTVCVIFCCTLRVSVFHAQNIMRARVKQVRVPVFVPYGYKGQLWSVAYIDVEHSWGFAKWKVNIHSLHFFNFMKLPRG